MKSLRRIFESISLKEENKDPLVSVIIPVFNADRSIFACLHSVLSQTLADIEVICVDDRSTDKSVSVITDFMKFDRRVRLIRHGKNLGPGGARNTGIAAAKAPFIASVDSDDTMQCRMLEMLLTAARKSGSDIVCCGYHIVRGDGLRISTNQFEESTIYISSNTDILNTLNPAFWNKIWRKSLFSENEISFPEHIYFQDAATTPKLVSKSQKIQTIKDNLYNYHQRSGGITMSFTQKHLISYYLLFEGLHAFLQKNGLWNANVEAFATFVAANLDYHAKNCVALSTDEPTLRAYLRQLLLLKAGYLFGGTAIERISKDEILAKFLEVGRGS